MGIMKEPTEIGRWWTDVKKVYYLDLLERVFWTFLQGFCAFWIITGEVDSDTLLAGVVAGGLAVAKGVVAKAFGSHQSAATLPQPPDYTAGE
jgi:hypothetical protein